MQESRSYCELRAATARAELATVSGKTHSLRSELPDTEQRMNLRPPSRSSTVAVRHAGGRCVLAGAVGTDRAGPRPAPTDRAESAHGHVRTLGRADAPVNDPGIHGPAVSLLRAALRSQTLPLLRAALCRQGSRQFVSHDLPLNLHAYALPAAVAARCAGEQGHTGNIAKRCFADRHNWPRLRTTQLAGTSAWTSRASLRAATIRSRHPW